MKNAFVKIGMNVIALSLIVCVGGCAQQPTQSGQTPQASTGANASASSGKAAEQDSGHGTLLSSGYVDLMKSGKFLIRYKASVSAAGETTEAEVTTATDGKAVASTMKMEGVTTHTIIRDNELYMLDDTNKTYSKKSISQEEKTEKTGSLTDMENPSYVGNGTGTVNGKTLPYEEYRAGEETLRFYMDGGNLYAIVSKTKDSEMIMTVLELTGKVPDEMLSVPSDYKEGTVAVVPGGIDMTGEQQTETDDS